MTQRTINLYDGLEALYYFDSDYFDSGANELKDKSGHERHASAFGGPTVGVEGPRSFEAVSLDGNDDGFNVPSHDQSIPFSVFGLAKTPADRGHHPIYANSQYGDTSQGQSEFALAMNWNNISFQLSDSDDRITIGTGLPKDEWLPILGVADGSTMSVYVDGEVVDTADMSTISGPISYGQLQIGYKADGAMTGQIAAVGEWSRALSHAEAQFLSKQSAPRRAML